MKIFLIRHGQTDINKQNRLQGRHGLPLNEVGKQQALAAKEKLKNIKFDYVFSSPQTRAVQTAKIATEINPIIDERLNVYDIGQAENMLLDEVKFIDDFIPDPSLYEGVEDKENYIRRVYGFVEELIKKYSNQDINVLISGHSCVTGCISAYFEGMPEDGNFLKLATNNGEFKTFIA